MSTPVVPLDVFGALCQTVANAYPTQRTHGYRVTENQLFFFTTAANRPRHTKQLKGDTQYADDLVIGWQDESTFLAGAQAVAAQLDGLSGEVVSGLKQQDPVEWSAFWTQLQCLQRQLPKQFDYQLDQGTQDEALAQCCIKVFNLIQSMPAAELIDGLPAILPYTRQRLQQPGALYTFRKPFLHYIFRILQNEFRRALQKVTNESTRVCSLDELLEIGVEPALDEVDLGEVYSAAEIQRLQSELQQQLTRLLAAIETLPRKRRQVAAYTLAGRPQFWSALKLTAIAAPAWYPLPEKYITDRQIAAELDMTDNSVRANRNHGYRALVAIDPAFGHLFSILSAVNY